MEKYEFDFTKKLNEGFIGTFGITLKQLDAMEAFSNLMKVIK